MAGGGCSGVLRDFPSPPTPAAKDASAAECAAATQLTGTVLPFKPAAAAAEYVAVTKDMKDFRAYAKVAVERMNKRWEGRRIKRAEEAAAAEKEKAAGK